MTAVEWLAQELSKQIDNNLFMEVTFNKLLAQAKEMEKEQKQSDYMRGWNDGYQNKVKNPFNDNPKSE